MEVLNWHNSQVLIQLWTTIRPYQATVGELAGIYLTLKSSLVKYWPSFSQ